MAKAKTQAFHIYALNVSKYYGELKGVALIRATSKAKAFKEFQENSRLYKRNGRYKIFSQKAMLAAEIR
jgi:hypothetical protein